MKVSDFDYTLPEHLIAQEPLARRDESRLMVVGRDHSLAHRTFSDLPDLLRPDDVLILNNTRVLPARFFCRRETGGRVEGLFLQVLHVDVHCGEIDGETAGQPTTWQVMLRNAGRCKPGELLSVDGRDGQRLRLVENLGKGEWRVQPLPPVSPEDLLGEVGITPLPPYIRRDAEDRPADRQRYQTVYARQLGAVAAPTAGLHFTDALLQQLTDRGIDIHHVTLHVGIGTFAPVKAETVTDHDMHSETYELSAETAAAITAAKAAGRRIVAVGTTSVRTLESVARLNDGQLTAARGSTKLFLYPPAEFHVVDALITNFHLPKSTLLMLVAAFCDPGGTGGRELILRAYRQAIDRQYRFFSYGDAMLIQ